MTTSYNRNIERLKTNQANISLQQRNINTAAAEANAQRIINDTNKVINELSKLSPKLQKRYEEHQEKLAEQEAQAIRDAELQRDKDILAHKNRIQEIETAIKAAKLKGDIEKVNSDERVLLELKQQYLDLHGPKSFYDARAIEGKTGARQVGHVREKLRMFKEQLPYLFSNEFQNSREEFSLQGITFTAEQLRENSLALPQKEYAINILMDRVLERSGIYEYTPEMLLLNGVTGEKGIVEKLKKQHRAQAYQEYNVARGDLDRKRYQLEFKNSIDTALGDPEKAGEALAKLHLAFATTPTTNGTGIIGNQKAWEMVYNFLATQADGNDNYANEVGNWIIPDWLAAKVGAKKGTTFGQFWGPRISGLKSAIRTGAINAANEEKKYLDSKGTEKVNEFKRDVQNGEVKTRDDIRDLKYEFTNLGLTVPADITNYETLLDLSLIHI